MTDFNLTLHTPPSIDSYRPLAERLVDDWLVDSFEREIDSRGGSYYGRFVLSGLPYIMLRNFFEKSLGYEVRENGGTTWIGLIYEMEITNSDGVVERISLNNVGNAIQAGYVNNSGERVYSPFQENSESIDRYGRKEFSVETDLDSTAAAEVARNYLALNAWPRAEVVAMNAPTNAPFVVVSVAGYSYTLSWDFPGIGGEITAGRNTIAELIEWIVGESAFLSAGNIQSNALTCSNELAGQNGLQMINLFCDMGDANDTPWTFVVDRNLAVHYGPVDSNYSYTIGLNGISDRSRRPMNLRARDLTPGVFRRANVSSNTRPNMWLTDSRDFFVSRVGVDELGANKLSVSNIDEWELVQARQRIGE